MPSPNVTIEGVNFLMALEGSQITYYCHDGLLPSEQMVANCTETGNWDPDPAKLICNGIRRSGEGGVEERRKTWEKLSIRRLSDIQMVSVKSILMLFEVFLVHACTNLCK